MITAVADASQVAEARRLVSDYASRAGLPKQRVNEIALVVTELATNLLKHASGGQILAAHCDSGAGVGLEVLALDRGNGMGDPRRCMEDGYSTAGSPGNGLGAIERLADELHIYSRPGLGSAIMARFLTRGAKDASRTQLGSAVAPYPGEAVCGDAWSFEASDAGPMVMLADGSGHGVEAARAAGIAVQCFRENAGVSCEEIVDRMHRALMPTRGAAVAVARIDQAARLVRFVGVGNISAALVSDGVTKRMVSHNGTAGHVAPRIREFTYNYTRDPLVVLHSDGLTTRWDFSAYPGLTTQHPTLIAGVLLRDHRRGRDDASVVAMRALS